MMPELNTTQSVEVVDEADFDAVTIVEMGDGIFALSQVAEDGTLHNIILGPKQSAKFARFVVMKGF
jgi:hypothetical protein